MTEILLRAAANDPRHAYAELVTASNFSFLRGASHARDLVLTALLLGHAGIGIADRNTVAGVVRGYAFLKDVRERGLVPPDKMREGSSPGEFVWIEHPGAGVRGLPPDQLKAVAHRFRLAVGTRFVFSDGTPDIVAYPANRQGWARICRLLTVGKRVAKKGDCLLRLGDLLADTRHLLMIVMPDERLDDLPPVLARLSQAAAGSLWLGATMGRRGSDRRRLSGLLRIGREADVPLIAVNDVLYHDPVQRDLQDVVTCIREGLTIETAGRTLEANAERHLKPPAEMARLFRDCPEAVEETQHLLHRVEFDLGELTYEYPEEPVPPGRTPQEYLEEQTWKGAEKRYPGGIPEKVKGLIEAEFKLIAARDYARYFLTIVDIVRVADDKGILCQGRGSAANSAVCYALGITAVDPNEHDVLFARFISTERREPPDIDVDFEHERREEIIQHIYRRYGRERAGIAATVISYRPRSAIREVGKVMGLTEDVTARLAGMVWGSWGTEIGDNYILSAGLDPKNPVIRRAVDLAGRLLGFPRHLSQHVGGFVLARGRLDETVPIGNAAMEDRTFIEWDKDDIDALELMKVDVLALGMLTCIRKAFELIKLHTGEEFTLATVPNDKESSKPVYEMLCKGDSIGVFQVESRAQINMLPRLKPKEFYDLVIQVAIVRPGPIEGDMVHPYLRRRNGLEKPEFPEPHSDHGPPDELHGVLGKTLGVPLFQEQAMRLAMVAAKFSDDEANGLRKAMATFRSDGKIGTFRTMMISRMVARGYKQDFAERCFRQIEGFGSYGFPESHAASFAKLVYVSSWIKCLHPAVFACALLNSQPMGFYAPAQIVRDAREHGVEVRPVDINSSAHHNMLERNAKGELALRLGFRQMDGFREDWSKEITARRGAGFPDIETLRMLTRLPVRGLHILADADAFRSIGLDRREALWAVRRLPDDTPLPLFAAADARELADESGASLPAMPLSEHVAADYQTVRLSLKGHPMQFLRETFSREGVLTCRQASDSQSDRRAKVAGVVLVRQRPGKGNAIFITLEDETGITNVLLWARKFEALRAEVMGSRLMVVEGIIQKSPEGVVHLMAEMVTDRTAELKRLSEDHETRVDLSRADEVLHPQYPRTGGRHPRNVRVLPKSRDFH